MSANKQLTNIIGDASGPEAIPQLFHEKYQTLYNSVPTSDSDLSNIKNTLVERLHPSEVSNLDHVTPKLICRCIGTLKPGKGDGSEGFRSDHLINAGKSLNVLLSLLFRAIVIHGHYPHNLLVSTITSIPKDLKSSLCNVDNYRGISLLVSEPNPLRSLRDLQYGLGEMVWGKWSGGNGLGEMVWGKWSGGNGLRWVLPS